MFTPSGFLPAHALPVDVAADGYGFAFRGDRVLVLAPQEDEFTVTSLHDLASAGIDGGRHFLGMLGDRAAWRSISPTKRRSRAGMRYVGLRTLFFKVPEVSWRSPRARSRSSISTARTASAAAAARPRAAATSERAKECPACGLVAYPRVSPAMMALVTRGKEILLARAHRFATGHVQRARGLRRAGRDDRGLRPARSARGSRRRGGRASPISRASRGRFRTR